MAIRLLKTGRSGSLPRNEVIVIRTQNNDIIHSLWLTTLGRVFKIDYKEIVMKVRSILKVGTVCFALIFSSFAFSKALSDTDITNKVKSKIEANSTLSGTQIQVSTSNGVVSLSGNVDSDTQASAATEIAQSTTGVKDTNTTKLKVKDSTQPLKDTFITAKVKGMFIQQELFGKQDIAAMGITVETNNGIVSLSGTANNETEAHNAVKLAKKVAGVKEVKSSIKISSSNQ